MTNRRAIAHRLSADAISRDLGVERIGRRVLVIDELDSTNRYALDVLAAEGPPADGTVVFAEHQTAGRGRHGRAWHSPRGAGLLMTTLLFDDPDRLTPLRAVMAASVAVVEAVRETTDVRPTICWPNDIYVGNRKLAGILIETRRSSAPPDPLTDKGVSPFAIRHSPFPPRHSPLATRYSLLSALGIGLNCLQRSDHFPSDVRERATSLDIESSAPIDRTAVARALLRRLDHWITNLGPATDDALAAAWRTRTADLGRTFASTDPADPFRGALLDMHPAKGLLLASDDDERRWRAAGFSPRGAAETGEATNHAR